MVISVFLSFVHVCWWVCLVGKKVPDDEQRTVVARTFVERDSKNKCIGAWFMVKGRETCIKKVYFFINWNSTRKHPFLLKYSLSVVDYSIKNKGIIFIHSFIHQSNNHHNFPLKRVSLKLSAHRWDHNNTTTSRYYSGGKGKTEK